MKNKIHRNDEIIVLTGKDKGKRGKVRSIFPSGKAIVEGINLIKKHRKPVPNINQKGGIIQKEIAIQISNLAIFNEEIGKVDRIGFRNKLGKKVRIFKSNGKIIKN